MLIVSDFGANNRLQKRNRSDLALLENLNVGLSHQGVWTDNTNIFATVIRTSGGHDQLIKYDMDGNLVASTGIHGTADGQLNWPYDIWGDDAGLLYIGDFDNNRISIFDKDTLTFQDKFGTYGTGNDNFYRPISCAGDGTYLYIADCYNHRIVKRLQASPYTYQGKVGSNGTGNDQFKYPWGLRVYGSHLYIADYANSRVHKRLLDLTFVAVQGSAGSTPGKYSSPTYLAVDSDYIYMTDPGYEYINKIQHSDMTFDSREGGDMAAPYGICLHTLPPVTYGKGYLRFRSDDADATYGKGYLRTRFEDADKTFGKSYLRFRARVDE